MTPPTQKSKLYDSCSDGTSLAIVPEEPVSAQHLKIEATPLSSATASPILLAELDQFVNAARLLEIVWEPDSRPSLQWLRMQQKNRTIPFIRRGRLVFFRPRDVIAFFSAKSFKPKGWPGKPKI